MRVVAHLRVDGADVLPTIPMKNSCTEVRKKKPMRIGAILSVNWLQKSNLYIKYPSATKRHSRAEPNPAIVAMRSGTLEWFTMPRKARS